jgi:hypothetical protein
MLLAAGALIIHSRLAVQQAQTERETAASRLQRIEQQLGEVRDEAPAIAQRVKRFQQIAQSGMSGEEIRLEWIESLRELQQQLRLPGMSYEFSPQVSIETANVGAYAHYSSRLKIQLQLVHEEDLLNFLRQLQQRTRALILPRSCRLTRLKTEAQANDGWARLSAECEIDWVSLHRLNSVPRP